MAELTAFLFDLGWQLWQQQEGQAGGGPSVCFVAIAPFLLGAGLVGLRSVRQVRQTGKDV